LLKKAVLGHKSMRKIKGPGYDKRAAVFPEITPMVKRSSLREMREKNKVFPSQDRRPQPEERLSDATLDKKFRTLVIYLRVLQLLRARKEARAVLVILVYIYCDCV
jgi:hypothetical protein